MVCIGHHRAVYHLGNHDSVTESHNRKLLNLCYNISERRCNYDRNKNG